MHWGIYEVEPHAGALPVLHGLSTDEDPSPIGLDMLDAEVSRLRIRRPAIRRGWLENGPGPTQGRGHDEFVEVDWDTALDHVAAEVARVRREHGNGAIFGGSYGWSSAGRFHHAQSQLHRFLNAAGGYVRSVDSYSLGAGRALMPYLVMSMDELNASHTSWEVLAEHCRLFVTFGGVPLKNTQVASGGAGDHRARGGLRAMAAAGTRFVNISPVRDNLETSGPVEWIPIRPNTDTALMLALGHEALRHPRFDRAFLDRCTVGFDGVRAYLTGGADGTPKTPEWAEAITGVPAARTRALADELMGTRSLVNAAWSLQRAAHGEQPFWAALTLGCLIGQVGLPGGGFALGYGPMNTQGSSHPRFGGPTLPQGRNPVGDFIPVARIADMLLHPGEPFTYRGETRAYPDIRLVYWAGGNPFHHHQDLNRLQRAWGRPETVIVHEPYWTPTARRADIVLPATTPLERNDIGFATREGHVVAMERVVAPFAEARDDYAILSEVAERLGLRDAFTEGLEEAGWLRRLYGESAARAAAVGIDLPDFQQFWHQGIIRLAPHDKPFTLLAEFRENPDAHPLNTPTGRIELFSETIAAYELEDCPGQAMWREPTEWLGAPKAAWYPLHLLSDQPQRRLHSQLDHSPYSRAGKVAGREPVYLNPEDATARGIADGDLVELFNDRGRCLAGAIVSPDIMPGVARLATGAWFDPEGTTEKHGNPNSLTLDRGASSFSQGCAAQSCLVEAQLFKGPPPLVTAFTLPRGIAEVR
jgi:biotin/methionine sulfoxide reductase